jgi:serpin B
MSRLLRTLAFVVAALPLAVCHDAQGPDNDIEPAELIDSLPRQLSVAEEKLIEADNRFAFKLFREINRFESDKNIFVSPLSAAMALGMTYNGAAGSTQQAMQTALQLQGMSLEEVNQSYRDLIDLLRNLDPLVEFILANSIWYRNTMTVKQPFLDLASQFFDAEISALDFADPSASRTINAWVSENTNGKIERMVPDVIPAAVVMYLMNAIYFRADWTTRFDQSLTDDARFYLKGGSHTTVDMMRHDEPIGAGYNGDAGVTIVDIPYGGQAFSMTVLVPDTPAGIDGLVDGLTEEQWGMWIDGLAYPGVVLSLPKFALEYEIRLNAVLASLGMGVAFGPGADLSGICCQPGALYIDEVFQKAYVDVNEEGTEAAAVTVVVVATGATIPVTVIVDRPFVFVIRERLSGTVLFMGKVMDPTAG